MKTRTNLKHLVTFTHATYKIAQEALKGKSDDDYVQFSAGMIAGMLSRTAVASGYGDVGYATIICTDAYAMELHRKFMDPASNRPVIIKMDVNTAGDEVGSVLPVYVTFDYFCPRDSGSIYRYNPLKEEKR